MYYYLWMLVAAVMLCVISIVLSIRKIRVMKSYRNTIKQFNEIHLELEQQLQEESFSVWDTVYVIDRWIISHWILCRVIDNWDNIQFDVEFAEDDNIYYRHRFEPTFVFKNLLQLIEFYTFKFDFILENYEDGKDKQVCRKETKDCKWEGCCKDTKKCKSKLKK